MYDIENILAKKGLSREQIDQIKFQVHREFPDDDMMYRLHLIRVVHAIQNGYCSLQNILEPSQKRAAP